MTTRGLEEGVGREDRSSLMFTASQSYRDKESLAQHLKPQEVAPSCSSYSNAHPESVSTPV